MGKVIGGITDAFGLTDIKGTQQRGEQAAEAQRAAALQGAQASSFRPVGMTTRFGTSNFGITDVGGIPRVTSAEYQVSPELRALQDQLFGLTGGAMGYAQGAQQAAAPLGAAAQGLFGLGSQFLPTGTTSAPTAQEQQYLNMLRGVGGSLVGDMGTGASGDVLSQQARLAGLSGQVTPRSYDPTAAAQSYFNEQMSLLNPERARQEQRLGASVFGRGRAGLNVGDMGQPELFALGTAREQQNALLAAQSRERARGELQQDIGLGTTLGQQAIGTGQQGEAYRLAQLQSGLGLYGQGLGVDEAARQRMLQNLGVGSGLFNQGAGLLGSQYGIPTQSLGALQSYLGSIGAIEELGQDPFRLGLQVGGASQPGATAGANLLSSGLSNAALTQQRSGDAASAQLTNFMGGMLKSAIGGFGGAGGGFGGIQSAFSQTGLGSSGFGTGLAYGNRDYGTYF